MKPDELLDIKERWRNPNGLSKSVNEDVQNLLNEIQSLHCCGICIHWCGGYCSSVRSQKQNVNRYSQCEYWVMC